MPMFQFADLEFFSDEVLKALHLVCDDDGGAVLTDCLEGLNDEVFCLGVEVRGGFI